MPHNHYFVRVSGQSFSTEKNLSLADLIKVALSQDLGTNHLEEYTTKAFTDAVEVVLPALFYVDNHQEIEFQGSFAAQEHFVEFDLGLKRVYFLTFGFRGPPTLSWSI